MGGLRRPRVRARGRARRTVTGPSGPVSPGRTPLARRLPQHHGGANHAQEEDRVDNPAGYLHLGFIVISLPNLALIAAMVVLFVIALVAPFPRHGGRRGGGE